MRLTGWSSARGCERAKEQSRRLNSGHHLRSVGALSLSQPPSDPHRPIGWKVKKEGQLALPENRGLALTLRVRALITASQRAFEFGFVFMSG